MTSIENKPLLDTDQVQMSLKDHLEQTVHNSDPNTTSTRIEDEKTPSVAMNNNNNTNNMTDDSKTGESGTDENVTIRDFYTEYGTQRVTISGDLNSDRPVIMTFHDIGINHVGCFQSFFSIVDSYPNILRYFVVVHIDVPGHHYSTNNSQTGSINKTNNSNKSKMDTNNVDSFDLTKLASFIENIEFELKISRFFGFGVGAGCNVWLEYAKQNRNNNQSGLRGLILINPTNTDASWSEWGVNNMFHYMGHQNQFLRDSLFGSLMRRYNGWEPLTVDSKEFLLKEINKIDEISAIKYFRGYAQRKALSKKELKSLKCRILVLVSEESKALHKCLEFQSELPDALVDFVKFDHGSYLMTESHPQQLVKPIQMFVESLGVSLLTMEMKFGKIED